LSPSTFLFLKIGNKEKKRLREIKTEEDLDGKRERK
jgi:hypothetical protein